MAYGLNRRTVGFRRGAEAKRKRRRLQAVLGGGHVTVFRLNEEPCSQAENLKQLMRYGDLGKRLERISVQTVSNDPQR
jgi:hypothetical protein